MVLQKSFVVLLVVTFVANDYLEVLATPNGKKVGSSCLKKPDNKICGLIPESCPETCYRSYDGSCNNLAQPGLGISNSTYNRLLPANYGDGYKSTTKAISGNPLPNPRKVSAAIYPDLPIPDVVGNLNAATYGQIIAHDMSSFMQERGINCCTPDGQMLTDGPKICDPIPVPEDDPDYSPHNITCMSFVKTGTDKDLNCTGDRPYVEQINAVSHYMDLSMVYGNSIGESKSLRSFCEGKLRSDENNGQEMMPQVPELGFCTKITDNDTCFLAGDIRVNQNPHLTIFQTLLLREHNRIADELAALNPHWDDDRIFQEARKINIAQHQHRSYYELLPIFIGIRNAYASKIIYSTKDYVDDYAPNIDPRVLNEHTTAAYRFFHTLLAGSLKLVTESRTTKKSIRISDFWNRPAIISKGESFDDLTRGACTQAELGADIYHDKEITLHLFRLPNATIGDDLKTICIQRNRHHGLASYNDIRQLCGLRKATKFLDFADVIPLKNVLRLSSLYEHPNDVELTVGGSLETVVPGAMAGPTFLCILTKQFYRTRVGDRFWFERPGKTGFKLPQLNEIRKATVSRLICDNSKGIKHIQPAGFKKVSPSNILMSCELLPSMDLSLWKESQADSNCACSSTNSKSSTTEIITENPTETTIEA